MLIRILKFNFLPNITRRSSGSMLSLCPAPWDQLVIWESHELLASLHPSPWTPGLTVLMAKEACTKSGSVFALQEPLLRSVFLAAQTVAKMLCERLGVCRCALVHYPGGREDVRILLVPLHGLEPEWRPRLGAQEAFTPFDPGFISSRSGPRWRDQDLEEMKNRIKSSNAIESYSFHGDPADMGLFPRIIRGEEKQWRVWEDHLHVAFLTPFPNTPGLTVVVPRKPLHSDILSLTESDCISLVLAAQKVSQLLETQLGARGVGLIFEGFEINYAHAKLIPLVSAPKRSETSAISMSAPGFFEHYPGFVTSASGPTADREPLLDIWRKITQK